MANPNIVSEALEWLDAQWRLPTRLSTIPQAMTALGLAEDDPARWDVAAKISRSWRGRLLRAREAQWGAGSDRLNAFWQQLRTWQFPTIALTSGERLVGAALVGAAPPMPSPGNAGERMHLPAATLEAAYDALARVRILEAGGDGYRFRSGYRRLLGGLGLSFHTVTVVDDSDTFNTTCAIDYVVLAKASYKGRRLRLDDACARSLVPITVEYDGDRVYSVDPAEPVLYRGGPCGQNLLFASASELEAWLGAPPSEEKAAPLSTWLTRWGAGR